MTRNAIIEQWYNSKEVNECIGKMQPAELREDLKQELFIALLETPEEKLIQLHENNQFNFYAVRIILNMIQSNTSEFFRKYRRNEDIVFCFKDVSDRLERLIRASEEWDDERINPSIVMQNAVNNYQKYNRSIADINPYMKIDEDEFFLTSEDLEERHELFVCNLEKELNHLYWYNKELFLQYVKHRSYRKLETLTGIPASSIRMAVNKAREQVKKKLKESELI